MVEEFIRMLYFSKLLFCVLFISCMLLAIVGCTSPEEKKEDNTIVIQNEVKIVTTDQLKKVKRRMNYKEVMGILGKSTDIGSGFYIFQYQHTDGSKIIFNFGSLDQLIGNDEYNNIQTILKHNSP
jgi:outer membrane protein assembly factor BamE (lipoprotein component of BamABCDE complex)